MDDKLTKAELMLKAHAAKRDFPKVGDEDHPTPWDLDHRRIDELLDQLEATRTEDRPGPAVPAAN